MAVAPHTASSANTTFRKELPIKRALVSVTDKTGVVDFVRALHDEFGVEIISTGGTAQVLSQAGISVTPIEAYTGFPEMMDGRVKTLHPRVHGGLLCRRDNEQHLLDARKHDIVMIDLVCVNLYEFEKTIAQPDVTFDGAIEHIDIGGPSMLRSAAKNNDFVTVVTDSADYEAVLAEMHAHAGATTLATRRRLARKVYATTAAYDHAIAEWLGEQIAAEQQAQPQPNQPATQLVDQHDNPAHDSLPKSCSFRSTSSSRCVMARTPIKLPHFTETRKQRRTPWRAPSNCRESHFRTITCSTPMQHGQRCASSTNLR